MFNDVIKAFINSSNTTTNSSNSNSNTTITATTTTSMDSSVEAKAEMLLNQLLELRGKLNHTWFLLRSAINDAQFAEFCREVPGESAEQFERRIAESDAKFDKARRLIDQMFGR